ncbi:dopamine N-acetyltransferase-like [Hyposmocoma kahamanoa]|uniref:dopamine N-acetyltransferase-like n=1 Tax=Hyposmocoma kahamanoa TaxID=1477025 RepID=UPI000E6D72DB|nr:dopamine N-acetyltransferase-like [Hyposmocoma kahamanoa]
MAVTSARAIVNLKEKGHFEQKNETERIDKYTLGDELGARLAALQICAMPPTAYTVRTLTTDDKESVLQFLRRFFFIDEPMNKAVQLLETPDSRCLELEEYATCSLEDGVSVAAVDDHGEFVGLVINGIAKREEVDYTDKSEDCPHPKFRRILKVLGHLDREVRIWDKLPKTCNRVVEIRIASTHDAWRGRGLMRVLCEETERIAKAVGASALRMDTTSAFSAAAAERLGYKQMYSVLYSDLDYAPQPPAPHLEARVYIKQI